MFNHTAEKNILRHSIVDFPNIFYLKSQIKSQQKLSNYNGHPVESYLSCDQQEMMKIAANRTEEENTRQVSSMIHSARPTVSPVVNIAYATLEICFVLLDFVKWGRTYGWTTHAKKVSFRP